MFDRTHRRDKGKGEYADKKSEAVAVSIRMQSIFVQICFRISFFVKCKCIIFIYVDVRENVNMSYSSSTRYIFNCSGTYILEETWVGGASGLCFAG